MFQSQLRAGKIDLPTGKSRDRAKVTFLCRSGNACFVSSTEKTF
jgi:hypothetical protein